MAVRSRLTETFGELIRRFSEQSNETAGEHFTPREVLRLMVDLLFAEDDVARVNTFENFMIIFADKFMNVVMARMDANGEVYKAILDDEGVANTLTTDFGRDLYRQVRDC